MSQAYSLRSLGWKDLILICVVMASYDVWKPLVQRLGRFLLSEDLVAYTIAGVLSLLAARVIVSWRRYRRMEGAPTVSLWSAISIGFAVGLLMGLPLWIRLPALMLAIVAYLVISGRGSRREVDTSSQHHQE